MAGSADAPDEIIVLVNQDGADLALFGFSSRGGAVDHFHVVGELEIRVAYSLEVIDSELDNGVRLENLPMAVALGLELSKR
ncbi:hypothetical protein ColKHC_09249 [Colletotrichum higginsianum]|nr:hypothetical protein ColKHC_09249 [Colletotrichum higginsianum]